MSERTLLEKANTLCERIEADSNAPRGEVRDIIFAIRDTLKENEALESSNALLARKVEAYERALKRLAGKCGAGHVCCAVTTDIALQAIADAARIDETETK